jgi:hypothetical protein
MSSQDTRKRKEISHVAAMIRRLETLDAGHFAQSGSFVASAAYWRRRLLAIHGNCDPSMMDNESKELLEKLQSMSSGRTLNRSSRQ